MSKPNNLPIADVPTVFISVAEIRRRCSDYPRVVDIVGREHLVDASGILHGGRKIVIREEPCHDAVQLAREWLSLRAAVARVQTPKLTSTSLKDAASLWCGTFIQNGAMILAAYQLGFTLKPATPVYTGGHSMLIGISSRWFKRQPERNWMAWERFKKEGR